MRTETAKQRLRSGAAHPHERKSPTGGQQKPAGPENAAMELRVIGEFLSLATQWPRPVNDAMSRAGNGRPVIVYPGLATNDLSTIALRQYLVRHGFDARPWGQGLNRGPREGVMKSCAEQLRKVHLETGQKVSLVGWSLGGLYARELAKDMPHQVRCVITLATPFKGAPDSTNARWIYEMLSGMRIDEHPLTEGLERTPDVPTTSIYSKTDGVVDWTACLNDLSTVKSGLQLVQGGSGGLPHAAPSKAGVLAENIEVSSSHFGMVVNPSVLSLVVNRLSEDPADWARYKLPGKASSW